MTVTPIRPGIVVPPIPRPRAAEPDVPRVAERDVPQVAEAPADPPAELPAARYPWPEPWRSARGARPRNEFWDVTTASWRSRGPLLRPRPED